MTPALAERIRVLAVDHTAGVRPFRKKHDALAACSGVELTVLAPEQWVENYRLVATDPGSNDRYRLRTGGVVWPGYENRGFFRSGLGTAIREVRPDILHLWEEPFSVITLQALWHASLWAPKARAIFHSADNLSRGFRYPYRPSWLYAQVERMAHARCAAGTVVSSEVADVLRSKGFTKPLERIPLGLDLSDYPAASEPDGSELGRRATPDEVRDRLGLDPPVVGFVGRLLHQKGIDLLLRAVASVPEPRPSLAILGDGPARPDLQALAAELGIGSRVRFLDLVPHEVVPSVLACVDVLVLPSRTTPSWKEQFGRVLVEGMAAGCVVVGSSSGAIPEVIGDTGIVFPEEDAVALARALDRALRDRDLARALRIRARRRARGEYTWDAAAARLVGLYRKVLGRERFPSTSAAPPLPAGVP